MKKILIFAVLLMGVLILFGMSEALADDRIDLIIQKLLANDAKGALADIYFDGTTLWILLASFGLSFGMISLSSAVAKHFAGAGGGNGEAGRMAYQAVTKTAGSAVALAGWTGRYTAGWIKEQRKGKELESQRSAGNQQYNGGNSNNNNTTNISAGGNNNNNSGGGNNNNNSGGGNNNNNSGGGNNNNNSGGGSGGSGGSGSGAP